MTPIRRMSKGRRVQVLQRFDPATKRFQLDLYVDGRHQPDETTSLNSREGVMEHAYELLAHGESMLGLHAHRTTKRKSIYPLAPETIERASYAPAEGSDEADVFVGDFKQFAADAQS